MEEQAFYKTINSILEEVHKNSFGEGILYDMCSDKLHPWGNKYRLGDKLCFISRLNKHELREELLEYETQEADGKQVYLHRRINEFGAIRDMLLDSEHYKAFVEKIAGVNWQFAYDAGSDDIARFKESLFAVLEFNDILKDAIYRYDELFDPRHIRNDNFPFVSKFLHFHRPEQFFMYDSALRKGTDHFRSPSGCRIAEAIIDDESKSKIEEICRSMLNSMQDEGVLKDEKPNSPQADYLHTMGLEYAICCYIKEHSDKIGGLSQHPFPLISSEVLKRMRKVKTEEEIVEIIKKLKPETPIYELACYCEDSVELDQVFEVYMRQNNKK